MMRRVMRSRFGSPDWGVRTDMSVCSVTVFEFCVPLYGASLGGARPLSGLADPHTRGAATRTRDDTADGSWAMANAPCLAQAAAVQQAILSGVHVTEMACRATGRCTLSADGHSRLPGAAVSGAALRLRRTADKVRGVVDAPQH